MRRQVRVASIGAVIALGSLSAVARAESKLEATVRQMPENSWTRVNANQFSEVWTPPDQRPIPYITPASNIDRWGGAAWDRARRWLMIYGGDVGREMGNEVYYFDTTDLLWHRGSLPSAMLTSADNRPYAIDGTDAAPRSGESWDNLVYLENLDRFVVINTSWNGPGFRREDAIVATGPYFWDPSTADPEKVGGTTGSQVDPEGHPEVVGGRMWQNRDTWAKFGLGGAAWASVSAAANENGLDVVYWGENPSDKGRLWKATFYDSNPENDRWEVVGRTGDSFSMGGAGAYDARRHAFVRIAGRHVMYWDLNSPGPDNRQVSINPAFENSEPWSMSDHYGIDYDSVNDLFVLWAGAEDVWWLDPPAQLDPDGWRAYRIRPQGEGPILPDKFIGVHGKWIYMPDERAFIGVVDGQTGDVWVYRPPMNSRSLRSFVHPRPEPLESTYRLTRRCRDTRISESATRRTSR